MLSYVHFAAASLEESPFSGVFWVCLLANQKCVVVSGKMRENCKRKYGGRPNGYLVCAILCARFYAWAADLCGGAQITFTLACKVPTGK